SKSEGASLGAGGEMLLLAGQTSAEWAIFEAFNAGSECDLLSIEATVTSGSGYLLLPDYDSGRWFVITELSFGKNFFSTNLDLPEYYSPLHRQYFALVADRGC